MTKPVLTLGQSIGNHRDILHDGVIIGRAVNMGRFGGSMEWQIWYGGSPVELFAGTANRLRTWLATGPDCFPVTQAQA